jgi:hypothetical protein
MMEKRLFLSSWAFSEEADGNAKRNQNSIGSEHICNSERVKCITVRKGVNRKR